MKPIEEIIQKLQPVIDTVETICLNDIDGWNAVCSDMHAILPCIPDEFSVLSQVIDLSIQGINAIILKTACNNFAAVEAVSKGICVCKQCLEEGTLPEDIIDTVIQSLNQVISVDAVVQESLPVGSESNAMLQDELNDIAALWVQLEPDDTLGVSKIKQLLAVFSDHDGLYVFVKDQILKSIEILDMILLLEVDSLADSWACLLYTSDAADE